MISAAFPGALPRADTFQPFGLEHAADGWKSQSKGLEEISPGQRPGFDGPFRNLRPALKGRNRFDQISPSAESTASTATQGDSSPAEPLLGLSA